MNKFADYYLNAQLESLTSKAECIEIYAIFYGGHTVGFPKRMLETLKTDKDLVSIVDAVTGAPIYIP